jgi:glycosyltransferase involved in cell wall biosynthesis
VPESTIIYTGSFRFPTGDAGAARVLGIGKTLRTLGHEVVFGGGETDGRPEDQIESATYRYQGFTYFPQGNLEHDPVGPFSRVLQMVTNGKKTLRWIDACRTRGIKAIIAYGPPTTLQLQLMSYARHHAIPLILDLAEWPAGRNLPGGPTGLRKLDSEFRMRYLNRKSDNIIAISSFLSEYYRRFGRHVIRIPPLIDLDEPKWKTPSKNKSGALRLIYAGTPGNKDLLGSIIRGTLLFQSEIRAIELHLVGVTEEQARNVDSRCLTSSKASNIAIICHGRVAQEKVPAMLARASFSVLLRPDEKYAHAGFATKLVESLSAGTPVIANATSDVAEYIRDGHEGLIVNGYSPEALAATLNIAAALPETKRLEMSNAARARAREVFDYRSRCSELRQFLALLPGTRSRH